MLDTDNLDMSGTPGNVYGNVYGNVCGNVCGNGVRHHIDRTLRAAERDSKSAKTARQERKKHARRQADGGNGVPEPVGENSRTP